MSMGAASIGERLDHIQQQSIEQSLEKSKRFVNSIMDLQRGPTVSDVIENLKGKRKGMYDLKMQKFNEYNEK
jgi:hypothetical protein